MDNPRKTYTDKNETGCCPIPNITEWDEKEFEWKDKKFIKDSTLNFLYVPLNMGAVIKRMWNKIKESNAQPLTEEWILLSTDPSPWKGEHFASVTKDVKNADNVTISGKFISKVFEGDYKQAGLWVKQMNKYIESKGEKLQKLYFFYTTCPKCAKHYGKNYIIAFAQIA